MSIRSHACIALALVVFGHGPGGACGQTPDDTTTATEIIPQNRTVTEIISKTRTASEITPKKCLAIDPVGKYRRAALHTDAIEAQIVAGLWTPPEAGDVVVLADGTRKTWAVAQVGDDGWFRAPVRRLGYAYIAVQSDAERVMLLEASGHGTAYVNGRPRGGDPYRTGWQQLPVLLHSGRNDLLFHVSRGLRVKLTTPKSAAQFNLRDRTLPDLIVGQPLDGWGAVIVLNSTRAPLDGLSLRVACGDMLATVAPLPVIPPLSARKVPFSFRAAAAGQPGKVPLKLTLVAPSSEGAVLDSATLELEARNATDSHVRTFVSNIDGSVQYYAVTPARLDHGHDEPPALFLTLHGAGVEARGQARSYKPKNWGHVVAPTNRRHYGFDWEDWGRLDAMEVLALAQESLGTDPNRTYLTGHSMGGHGTWLVGATYPDRFAAIAPSAGWISFWSYAGAARYEEGSPIERILRRATSPSDTLGLSRNYLHHGVYILHGSRDDNVPVDQARTMRKHLADYHSDFAYYERPGAGHWWGSACVDWPPLFDFLKHHTRPAEHAVRRVRFVTANPGISARSRWITIEAQTHALALSRVDIRFEPGRRAFVGTTENVARLTIDLAALSQPRWREQKGERIDVTVLPSGKPLSVELDGVKIDEIAWPAESKRVRLSRDGEEWRLATAPSPLLKGPLRYGPFKDAFRNRMIFVYGTAGNAQENSWAFAKARYDAETFWYRGNGSMDVVADRDFDPHADRDRNVILYGNADTNTAWGALLTDSPVVLARQSIRVGRRTLKGGDLGCLLVRPRPNSDIAVVGVVGGSGIAGMRLTDRLPYFVSGVAYPDCIVIGPDILETEAEGVRVAGFFGIDWSVERGDFAWRD